MEIINVFESTEFLEPKCPKCEAKIDYGTTTEWDEKEEAHKCKSCGTLLR